MPTDLTLILHDQPGELARVGEVAGSAGIHIRGMAAFTGEGRGVVHVLIDDGEVERAVAAFKGERLKLADQREVLVVDLNDRPGSLGELARELAEANVNVELAYPTFTEAQLVIATDDMRQRARRARLKSLSRRASGCARRCPSATSAAAPGRTAG